MNATAPKDRWRNAFIYAFVTTVMLLGVASILVQVTQGAQRELAERVDRNAAVSVTAADSIICILQLGVGANDPPRTHENVLRCLEDNGYLDIPTEPEPSEGG